MTFEPNLPRTRVKASGIVKSPPGRHTGLEGLEAEQPDRLC